jgi:hypothetical protein
MHVRAFSVHVQINDANPLLTSNHKSIQLGTPSEQLGKILNSIVAIGKHESIPAMFTRQSLDAHMAELHMVAIGGARVLPRHAGGLVL